MNNSTTDIITQMSFNLSRFSKFSFEAFDFLKDNYKFCFTGSDIILYCSHFIFCHHSWCVINSCLPITSIQNISPPPCKQNILGYSAEQRHESIYWLAIVQSFDKVFSFFILGSRCKWYRYDYVLDTRVCSILSKLLTPFCLWMSPTEHTSFVSVEQLPFVQTNKQTTNRT